MRFDPIVEGDIVDIVAPASRCSTRELQNGIKALRAIGLRPRLPKPLFAPSVLFSNSDEKRLRHLKNALYAGDSKMIWCVRGGYGSLRLVPEMLKWRRPKQGKIVLGYSDITTLHLFLNQKWKWPTLHGPMLERFGRGTMSPAERSQLLELIFGEKRGVDFMDMKPLNKAARKNRMISAHVIGGNMAVLQSSMGTPLQIRPHGEILFFEDTGERPHRVDRMLTQFSQAGVFTRAKAIVLGHFLLNELKDRRQLWNDVIPRFAAAQKIPVLAGLPVGHNLKRQFTLPLATPAILHTGTTPSLIVDSGIGPALG